MSFSEKGIMDIISSKERLFGAFCSDSCMSCQNEKAELDSPNNTLTITPSCRSQIYKMVG